MVIDYEAIMFWDKGITQYEGVLFHERFWEDRKLEENDQFFQDMFKGTIYGPHGPECAEDNLDMFLSKRFIRYLEKLQ